METTKAEIVYPQWSDVGIPASLQDAMIQLEHGPLLTLLVEERVFHTENKTNFIYTCGACGWHHIVNRSYEAYDECQKCHAKQIKAVPFWKNSKDTVKPTHRSELVSYKIAEQMGVNYRTYFNVRDSLVLELYWNQFGFNAKFKGGTGTVVATSPYVAIAKAAILCPYLWDSSFNWKIGRKTDKTADCNITHLVYQWAFKDFQ